MYEPIVASEGQNEMSILHADDSPWVKAKGAFWSAVVPLQLALCGHAVSDEPNYGKGTKWTHKEIYCDIFNSQLDLVWRLKNVCNHAAAAQCNDTVYRKS